MPSVRFCKVGQLFAVAIGGLCKLMTASRGYRFHDDRVMLGTKDALTPPPQDHQRVVYKSATLPGISL